MNIEDFLSEEGSSIADKIENETSFKNEKLKGLQQDREERKKYAARTFIFLCCFTASIILIIILSGLTEWIKFKISDTVLITLITTSFTTVVSIFVFVMKYLFEKSNK